MKFIGFLKNEDKNIRSASEFKDMFTSEIMLSTTREKVVKYLYNGVFLTGVMSYIYDIDGIPIGNLNYYTDGDYIWPIYYPYYLNKYENFIVSSDFLDHVFHNNFCIRMISNEELRAIGEEFDAEWAGYWKKK
jgi:hypothetical protein